MATSRSQVTRAEWRIVLAWVVATTVGWVIGFAVCEAFSAFLKSLSSDGLVIGTFVGIAQWRVLRSRFNRAGWWILVSIVGFGLGKVDGNAVANAIPGALGFALGGAAIGTTLGIAQWLVLQRHVATAGWWIPANTFGWAAGWIIIGSIEETAGGPTATTYLIGSAGAALAGLITAAALIWLLRTRAAQPA